MASLYDLTLCQYLSGDLLLCLQTEGSMRTHLDCWGHGLEIDSLSRHHIFEVVWRIPRNSRLKSNYGCRGISLKYLVFDETGKKIVKFPENPMTFDVERFPRHLIWEKFEMRSTTPTKQDSQPWRDKQEETSLLEKLHRLFDNLFPPLIWVTHQLLMRTGLLIGIRKNSYYTLIDENREI